MIRIGDFARLGQVTVPTLRHYDEVGLLKPVSVDDFSGYRYYSVSQLPRLNRILALKDLGLSLDEIERVLADELTPEELRGMLKRKQAEVELRLADERERLERIEARLRQIDMEDSMPNYEVVIKTTPAMRVVSKTVRIPTNDQVPEILGGAIGAVYEYAATKGAKPSAPHLAIWHQGTEVVTDEIAEAILPIDREIAGTDDIRVYELAPTQVAAAVHHGDFETFQQTHVALLKWIEENGYRINGHYREIYIKHDPMNLSDTTTEIQFPVEKG